MSSKGDKKEEKVITLRLPYSSEEKALILEVLRRVEKSCKDLPNVVES